MLVAIDVLMDYDDDAGDDCDGRWRSMMMMVMLMKVDDDDER